MGLRSIAFLLLMPILLKDFTADQLHGRLACIGLTPRQARQIHAAVVRRGTLPAGDEGIAAKVLDEVRRLAVIPNLTLVEKTVSPQDGFAKYLFRGQGVEPFEAVRIPLLPPAGRPQVCSLCQLPGGLRDAVRVLCHGPDGVPPQSGRVGNRRPGDQGPGRLALSRARRRFDGAWANHCSTTTA